MSIFDDFVKDSALHAFKLTTNATLPNAGLSQKTAVVSGATASNGLPLWAGGDKPLAFGATTSVTVTDTLYSDRTMECLYVPADQDAGVIMQNGQVAVEEIGGVLNLTVEGLDPVTIEWDREQSLIALARSDAAVTLWCNGEEVGIDIPDDFVFTESNDFVLSPTGGFADAFAVYNRVVSSDSLEQHFADSRNTPAYDSVLNSLVPAPDTPLPTYVDEATIPIDGYDTPPPPVPFGYYMGNDNYRIITKVQTYDTNEDFLNAIYDTVTIGDDMVSGDSGTWTGSMLRPETPAKIEWEGVNVTCSLSADAGTTWTPVENHSAIPDLAEVADIGTIDIQFQFAAGGELRNLTITTFQDNLVQGDMTDRLLAIGGDVVTSKDINYPIEQNKLAGFRLNAGSLTIQTVAGTETVQSVMFWIKPDTITDGTLFHSDIDTVMINGGVMSGATTYVNGQLSTQLTAGVWNHVVITDLTATAGDLFITPPMPAQLSMLTIMTEALTADDALYLYGCFFGYPAYQWSDNSLNITELADAYSSVQGDWGITSSY